MVTNLTIFLDDKPYWQKKDRPVLQTGLFLTNLIYGI